MIVGSRLVVLVLAGCLATGGCTAVPTPRTAPVRVADLESRIGCVDDQPVTGSALPVESATCDFDGVPVTFATFRDDRDREGWAAGMAGHVIVGTGWAVACADPDTVTKLALILGGVRRPG
jgi:hypothetical protein